MLRHGACREQGRIARGFACDPSDADGVLYARLMVRLAYRFLDVHADGCGYRFLVPIA